jgi:hypothetical protein
MARRKAGRANNDPLWWVRGGEAWMPTVNGKNANMEVCGFFFLSAHSYGCGRLLPL